jgi:hypothetical protein
MVQLLLHVVVDAATVAARGRRRCIIRRACPVVQVFVTKFVIQGTVEENILRWNEDSLSSRIVDGKVDMSGGAAGAGMDEVSAATMKEVDVMYRQKRMEDIMALFGTGE